MSDKILILTIQATIYENAPKVLTGLGGVPIVLSYLLHFFGNPVVSVVEYLNVFFDISPNKRRLEATPTFLRRLTFIHVIKTEKSLPLR